MTKGINKVILLGHCGQDPQVKDLPSGDRVVNCSLATGEKWKDRQTGEWVERTEWHRIVIFGKLADIAAQYLSKGRLIYLEGSVRTRKWSDNTGQDRYTTEVVVREFQLLDSAKGQNNFYQEGGAVTQNFHNETDEASKIPFNSKDNTVQHGKSPFDFDEDDPFNNIPF